jgi:hypothetical protein
VRFRIQDNTRLRAWIVYQVLKKLTISNFFNADPDVQLFRSTNPEKNNLLVAGKIRFS